MKQRLAMNRKPKNPVVVQSTNLLSQLVFSMRWSPEEVGSNTTEGMDLLVRQKQASKEQGFLLPCPYIGFQQKVWTRTKVRFPPQDLE